jgi:hypothetical protein
MAIQSSGLYYQSPSHRKLQVYLGNYGWSYSDRTLHHVKKKLNRAEDLVIILTKKYRINIIYLPINSQAEL